jgi:hypothetical protein
MHEQAVADPSLAVWGEPAFEADYIRQQGSTPWELTAFRAMTRLILDARTAYPGYGMEGVSRTDDLESVPADPEALELTDCSCLNAIS